MDARRDLVKGCMIAAPTSSKSHRCGQRS